MECVQSFKVATTIPILRTHMSRVYLKVVSVNYQIQSFVQSHWKCSLAGTGGGCPGVLINVWMSVVYWILDSLILILVFVLLTLQFSSSAYFCLAALTGFRTPACAAWTIQPMWVTTHRIWRHKKETGSSQLNTHADGWHSCAISICRESVGFWCWR